MTQHHRIGSVAIVGGTHGNELTGVYAVKHCQAQNFEQDYTEFQIEYLQANPEAIAQNQRYLDKDLNRCFKTAELADLSAVKREQQLAKQINQRLGPKGDPRVDFIIDLHTSTANMKTNIVLTKLDEFHLKLAAYLSQQIPDCVVTSESELMSDHHFLCSVADKGIVIEIGPIAQGTLDWQCFDKTQRAIKACLDFTQRYNQNDLPELNDKIQIYQYFDKLYFPCDPAGDICAMVHPSLIGNDYMTLKKGAAVFKDFAGQDILFEQEDAVIAFINEAAYYDQKIAMCLCRPVQYSIKKLLADQADSGH